jgi:hypothetical protein
MTARISRYLPVSLAVITGLVVAAVVMRQNQPRDPAPFLIFQIFMAGAAWLVAGPQRWLRMIAVLVLFFGVLVTGMSVGLFYIPTLAAAGWVMAMRLSNQATPSFLDTKPQNGVIYTKSDREAMKYRQSR